jgi:hypothetical protein
MRVRLTRIFCCLTVAAASCYGAAIQLPGGTLVIAGTNGTGASFVYNGTLTPNDTISFTQTGSPCLQAGGAYCTNGAGVVTRAGSSGVGAATSFSATYNNSFGVWNYGAVLMTITGLGAQQVFQANAANGLGSSTPPTTLTLPPTTLGALGFTDFSSVVNPTITFVFADDLYSDNTGSITLTQGSSPPPGTPAPSTWILIVCGLIAVSLVAPRLRAA